MTLLQQFGVLLMILAFFYLIQVLVDATTDKEVNWLSPGVSALIIWLVFELAYWGIYLVFYH